MISLPWQYWILLNYWILLHVSPKPLSVALCFFSFRQSFANFSYPPRPFFHSMTIGLGWLWFYTTSEITIKASFPPRLAHCLRLDYLVLPPESSEAWRTSYCPSSTRQEERLHLVRKYLSPPAQLTSWTLNPQTGPKIIFEYSFGVKRRARTPSRMSTRLWKGNTNRQRTEFRGILLPRTMSPNALADDKSHNPSYRIDGVSAKICLHLLPSLDALYCSHSALSLHQAKHL